MKNNRAFGVEIECATPGYGLEGTEDLLRKNGFDEWADLAYHDGSEIEIPSPILRGEDGLKELEAVMKLLKKNRFYVTEEDGMHVHHDVRDLTLAQIRVIAASWYNCQNVINGFVATDRRNGDWCRNLTISDLQAIDAEIRDPENFDRHHKYRALSLSDRGYKGTLEIRLHEGCLDFDKARAWILFGQAFITNCSKRNRPLKANDPISLLKGAKVYKVAQKKLLEVYA